MTLGEFIKTYRDEHNLSLRSFASMVGMSTQQISNIEKGIGNDGKPMTSTMKTYKKIAEAIGMTESDFLNMLSDDVRVNPSAEEELAKELQIMRDMPETRAMLHVYAGLDAEKAMIMRKFIESLGDNDAFAD